MLYEIKGHFILIDDEDYERIDSLSWWILNPKNKNPYFCHTGKRPEQKRVLLHRYILGLDTFNINPIHVDHINGNTFDNRKSNLRLCTKSQNGMNRSKQANNKSGYKGVCWDKSRSKWAAKIKALGKTINLGRFNKIEDAVEAYKNANVKYHGAFGKMD